MLGCAFFVADGIFNTKMTIDHKMKNWKRFWPFSDELHIKWFLYECLFCPKRKTSEFVTRRKKTNQNDHSESLAPRKYKIPIFSRYTAFVQVIDVISTQFQWTKLMTWKGRKFELKEAQRENWSMIISSEVLWLVLSQHQGIKKRKEETTAIQKRNRRNGLK